MWQSGVTWMAHSFWVKATQNLVFTLAKEYILGELALPHPVCTSSYWISEMHTMFYQYYGTARLDIMSTSSSREKKLCFIYRNPEGGHKGKYRKFSPSYQAKFFYDTYICWLSGCTLWGLLSTPTSVVSLAIITGGKVTSPEELGKHGWRF